MHREEYPFFKPSSVSAAREATAREKVKTSCHLYDREVNKQDDEENDREVNKHDEENGAYMLLETYSKQLYNLIPF